MSHSDLPPHARPPAAQRLDPQPGSANMGLPPPAVALAIGAHPDDVEFGCGATLARWAAQGTRIHHLICTDGSKGTWDVDADLTALVARRRDEQRAASRPWRVGRGHVPQPHRWRTRQRPQHPRRGGQRHPHREARRGVGP